MSHKIGAYLRVSTEEQAAAVEGSLDNQRYRLKSFIDIKNTQEKSWGQIVEFYIDDGFSAKDTKRPAYQRMMADIKKGKINLILITDLSRLSRNIHDFSNLLNDLDRVKATFFSIKEQFDTSSPSGKMMIYNLINLAQFEREQVSERVSLGVHARAMRGLLNGGRPILGYDKHADKPGVYILNAKEADQVRQIFKSFLETGSRAKTIQRLNDLGIKPKLTGKVGKLKLNDKWSSQTLGHLLNSAVYIGCHEVNRRQKSKDQETLKPFQRYQVVNASWPAIITEETFYRTQALLEEAKEFERARLEGAENRVYILSGTLRCGDCGHPLVGQSAHGSKGVLRYYGHTYAGTKHGCPIQRVSAEAIEKAVLDHLKKGLNTAGYFKGIEENLSESMKVTSLDNAREVRRVKQRLQELESQLGNMFLVQTQQKMSGEALRMLMETIEKFAKEKTVLSTYLEELSRQDSKGDFVRASVNSIKERLDEFAKGFSKANGNLKKRLIRRALKQLVLTREGLSIFFHLADGEEISGHKLQLVRDETSKAEKTKALFLTKRASGDDTNLSILRSDIGKHGDLTPS
ncbi:MAG TPA: recombinase family protein [Pseudobdellovibrionaceae bacterium]